MRETLVRFWISVCGFACAAFVRSHNKCGGGGGPLFNAFASVRFLLVSFAAAAIGMQKTPPPPRLQLAFRSQFLTTDWPSERVIASVTGCCVQFFARHALCTFARGEQDVGFLLVAVATHAASRPESTRRSAQTQRHLIIYSRTFRCWRHSRHFNLYF